MKKNRLNRVEEISAGDFPMLTPEQQQEDTEALLNELADIAHKLPPDDGRQTLKEVLAGFSKPRTTYIQTSDGKKLRIRGGVVTVIDESEPTKIDAPDVTKIDAPDVTFTEDELRILEELKNGEHS